MAKNELERLTHLSNKAHNYLTSSIMNAEECNFMDTIFELMNFTDYLHEVKEVDLPYKDSLKWEKYKELRSRVSEVVKELHANCRRK